MAGLPAGGVESALKAEGGNVSNIKMNRAEIQAISEKLGFVIPKPKGKGGCGPQHGKKSHLPKGTFECMCEAHGLPVPVAEYQFCEGRKWRFDWCWPEIDVALEVEGGIWNNGAHVRGGHFLSDMEKYNEACIAGWRVLRCTPDDMQTGKVMELLKRAFAEGT